jgi:hypothetical protein
LTVDIIATKTKSVLLLLLLLLLPLLVLVVLLETFTTAMLLLEPSNRVQNARMNGIVMCVFVPPWQSQYGNCWRDANGIVPVVVSVVGVIVEQSDTLRSSYDTLLVVIVELK